MEPNTKYKPDSIYNTIRTALYNNGLFENQAEAVLDRVIAQSEPMKGRWNDRVSDYPPAITTVLFLSAKLEAVKYIDENCPQHWARPMFTGEFDNPEPKTPGGGTAPKATPFAPAL